MLQKIPSPSSADAMPASSGFSYTGSTVLITGASSGLGAEFARQLAPQAALILLAARSADAMEKLALELKGINYSLQVVVSPCDLATTDGRAIFWQAVSTLPRKPDLLINNAGLGDYGLFAAASESRIQQQIDLNITALTLLAREFLHHIQPDASRPAAILNVSSLASALPVPDLAVYAATKSYVTSLTEALAVELRSYHVFVSAVCPGPTPTNLGNNARRPGEGDIDRGGQDMLKISPQRVVKEALDNLEKGGRLVFPGKRVALAAFVFRVMPRALLRLALNARFKRSLSKNTPA